MRRAEALLDEAVSRWGRAHRAPGVRDRQRLAARIAAELVAGGAEPIIIHELTRDMGDVRRAVAVMLGDRTATPGWGRAVDPRPDWAQYEVTGPRPVWCGRCDERTRLVVGQAADGSERIWRCSRCHPDAAADTDGFLTGEDVVPPPPLEVLAAQLDAAAAGGVRGEQLTPQRPTRPEVAAARERLAELRQAGA
ncbi:hypothetical protein ACQEU5_24800 [Marinactinospora thermotolerans]|uniref:hypothetical protein n=1 Tax=Marinactinospora thermotolerans TaxID=531310 RepID=UPI003D8C5FF5